MTPEELKDLAIFGRNIQHQYRIYEYSNDQLNLIMRSLNKSIKEIQASLARPIKLASDGRNEELLAELQRLSIGIRQSLTDDIASASVESAEMSQEAYGNLISFNGKVPGVNFISLSPAQLNSIAVSTPVGGKLLGGWVDNVFDKHLHDELKEDMVAGYLKGESTDKIARRIRDKFGRTKREIATLTKTWIAEANNESARKTYEANADVVRREEWIATLEVSMRKGFSTCMQCAALDGRKWKIGTDHPRPIAHPN